MNTEDTKRVGGLVDVDLEDLKQKKQKRIIGRFVFYLVQVFFFLFSSLLGYLFVLWEHSDRTGYPFTFFPRYFTLGSLSLINLHGGNITYSFFRRKKDNLRYIEVIPVTLVNLIISFVSFFMIYRSFYQPAIYPFSIQPLYGVYRKEMSTKYDKEIRL